MTSFYILFAAMCAACLTIGLALLGLKRRGKTHPIPPHYFIPAMTACFLALAFPLIPIEYWAWALLTVMLLCGASVYLAYRPRPSRTDHEEWWQQSLRKIAHHSATDQIISTPKGPLIMAVSLAGLWEIDYETAGRIVGCDMSQNVLKELPKLPENAVPGPTEEAWQRTWILKQIRDQLRRRMQPGEEARWVRTSDPALGATPLSLLLMPDLLGLQQVLASLSPKPETWRN